jgi:hypothetical protein
MQEPESKTGQHWLDDPANVAKLIRLLMVLCGLLVVADFFYAKHGHFGFEEWPGFHAFYGFAAFVFIVLLGKQLRRVLMRDEDYYDK